MLERRRDVVGRGAAKVKSGLLDGTFRGRCTTPGVGFSKCQTKQKRNWQGSCKKYRCFWFPNEVDEKLFKNVKFMLEKSRNVVGREGLLR